MKTGKRIRQVEQVGAVRLSSFAGRKLEGRLQVVQVGRLKTRLEFSGWEIRSVGWLDSGRVK